MLSAPSLEAHEKAPQQIEALRKRFSLVASPQDIAQRDAVQPDRLPPAAFATADAAVSGGIPGPGGPHGPARPGRIEHDANSDEHAPSSASHSPESDTHFAISSTHYDSSDVHYYNSDQHFGSTDSHFGNSHVHDSSSETHYSTSDTHDASSHDHFKTSDDHELTSESHFDGSSSHSTDSSTHTATSQSSSGDPERKDCGGGGSPNRGVTRINGEQSIVLNTFSADTCGADFTVDCQIITVDTPEERDLRGMLRLEVVSGDASCIGLEYGAGLSTYHIGLTIPIVAPGHFGCGVHTWHEDSVSFRVYPVKPGTVVLRAVLDPDPDSSGDGQPFTSATMRIVCPPQQIDHELVYKTFIPCPLANIPFPLPGYAAGDDRSFGATYLASSRTRQRAKVRIRYGHAGTPIVSSEEGFDTSHEYASSSVQDLGSAHEPCRYVLHSGATPSDVGTATERPSRLDVKGTNVPNPSKPWERIRKVTLTVDARYPLSLISCAIDSTIKIELKECGEHFWYRIVDEGAHDGFPAHEIYLDGDQIYQFDPQHGDLNVLCGAARIPVPPTEWITVD
ncbi:MAG: hypothetical protein ACKVWV_02400 [Planctomycetota bacterium]